MVRLRYGLADYVGSPYDFEYEISVEQVHFVDVSRIDFELEDSSVLAVFPFRANGGSEDAQRIDHYLLVG